MKCAASSRAVDIGTDLLMTRGPDNQPLEVPISSLSGRWVPTSGPWSYSKAPHEPGPRRTPGGAFLLTTALFGSTAIGQWTDRDPLPIAGLVE